MNEEIEDLQALWSSELSRHQIQVDAGEDPIMAGSIRILNSEGEPVGYVLIEDESLAIEVRRRMIAAGARVIQS
jgi:hypothetical protein